MPRLVARQFDRPWLYLIPIALLLVACQLPQPAPPRLTLAGAIVDLRVENAQEIARTVHEDETVVLFFGEQGVQDVVAPITLDRATEAVRTHGTAAYHSNASALVAWPSLG
jgi:hypothetical protein